MGWWEANGCDVAKLLLGDHDELCALGDALAAAVEQALALDGPLDYDTRNHYLGTLRHTARAWREARHV